ncbi:MAG: bifunctional DNA-formamidopyrimidine glycosylase/DNA-(apurinic or apyrimidinic site) lyase [Candidatus Alcyoniella australis]|nr:bifunctional DNA-formamidopyrimidine glycosylase/DNA-(apurinic or apyrimidinic site) lyase [Candidatus Alcyoniella australis]
MPELPEVETIVRQLGPLVIGRRLKRVQILDPKLESPDLAAAKGKIENIFRAGKQIVIELKHRGAEQWLCVHLRMTGRLLFQRQVDQRPRAILELDHGNLIFSDTRRFGTITMHRSLDELLPNALDPLDHGFTPFALAKLLSGSTQPLKVWLMRQDRLVGLGNIYASEILHRAKLSPFAPAGSLNRAQVRRLHNATRRVLIWAIDCCGTTFSDFQDARGEQGTFQQRLAVYGRESRTCKRCGAAIKRSVQAQRSTFYCPDCQS